MEVLLKRMWFGPDQKRYRAGVNTLPEGLRDLLPSDAKILGEEQAAVLKAPAKVEPQSLRDFDTARAAGEAEDKALAKAKKTEDEAAARAAAFKKQLEEEAAAEDLATARKRVSK